MVSDLKGVVLAHAGGRYRVFCDGATVEASLRGRLKRGEERVLVGDTVTLARHPDGSVTIDGIAPRRSVLTRRSPGRGRGKRVVAANVDQVVVVGATLQPVWDFQLIDRFTAVAGANALPVVIVINKCDLAASADPYAHPYQLAGYPVMCTSVTDHRGLDQLAACLDEAVSVLTGPTGAGKSSLLNAMQPGLQLRTGAVSAKSLTGRHTTVAAEMHPFGRRGFVVDTPGLRDVSLWGLGPADVQRAFPEFARVAAECRFDNCRHVEEPGCAVVVAARAGEIAPSRLASYRRLLQEALEAIEPWTSR